MELDSLDELGEDVDRLNELDSLEPELKLLFSLLDGLLELDWLELEALLELETLEALLLEELELDELLLVDSD